MILLMEKHTSLKVAKLLFLFATMALLLWGTLHHNIIVLMETGALHLQFASISVQPGR